VAAGGTADPSGEARWRQTPRGHARSHQRGRIDPHGYDAGKKLNCKKRHIAVDTLGLNLEAVVHPADIQDRDGGPLVDDFGDVGKLGTQVFQRWRLSRPRNGLGYGFRQGVW
jgi:hypothetical protein